MTVSANPYLAGNYAPTHEEATVTDLPVTGTIPPELAGRLLRNGPNPFAPDPDYFLFVGQGMVHGVRLRDGRAEWYRNRRVRGEGGHGPNTHVLGHAGRTWAVAEGGPAPVELTYELESVGPDRFGGTLRGPFSGHPHLDPATGELHAVGYRIGLGHLDYVVVDAGGAVRRTVAIPVADDPMVHDCAITASYALVLDMPVTFDRAGWKAGSPFPFRWDPGHGARVGLLPRDGGADDVRWCEVGLCYVFHPVNAYDRPDGTVVVDVIRHPTVFAGDGPVSPGSSLWRWTLDPAAGTVREEQLDDRAEEFPRIDERLTGRPYRYAYGAEMGAGLHHGRALKHDLVTGAVEVHDHGPGRVTLEPVFVPANDAAEEDDGWVMAYVYDAGTDTSDVVILHAQDFAGPPVATIHLPRRVPFGFHGSWSPDD